MITLKHNLKEQAVVPLPKEITYEEAKKIVIESAEPFVEAALTNTTDDYYEIFLHLSARVPKAGEDCEVGCGDVSRYLVDRRTGEIIEASCGT